MFRLWKQFFIGLFALFCVTATVYAVIPATPTTTKQTPADAQAYLVQTYGLNHWELGPLSIGGEYDTLLGMIFNTQYVQPLGEQWAVGMIGEYGPNHYRLNGTFGYQLSPNTQMKMTGEYLSQVLPFNFDSGNIQQRVAQSAYGFQLQQNFAHFIFQSLQAGGYWAKAPSVGLSSVQMNSGGLLYTNDRNIAGSESSGISIGSHIVLSPLTALKTQLFYDQVNYTLLFDNSSNNSAGIGGKLQLEQLLNNRMKILLKAEQRALYKIYGAEYRWMLPFTNPVGIELGVFAERLLSSNTTPSSNSFGLTLNLIPGDAANYTLAKPVALGELASWVKIPAVYMERVLVVAEQKTTLNGPVVSELVPSSGPLAGGNTVIINGTNFLSGTTVTFGGVAAATTLVSSTQLSVQVPILSSVSTSSDTSMTKQVNVVVTNPGGQQMIFTAGYTYTNTDAPTVVSLTPTFGSTAGGTSVTLTGTHFTDASAVTFDGTDATSFNVVDDSTLTALTPAHASGSVDVVVTAPSGSGNLPLGYTYANTDLPTVDSLAPTSGSTVGGTLVTLTGTHFTDASAVTFDGANATSFNVVDDSTLTAVTPAHAAGSVDVAVTTPNGSSSLSPGYTYIDPPTVSGVSPNSGFTSGGTSVTITGTQFTDATTVWFGASEAASFTINSATSITAVSPPNSAGTVDITVTTPSGTSSLSSADQFTYTSPPAIIFVTGTTYNGNLVGFSGADAKCNSDSAKPRTGFAAGYI